MPSQQEILTQVYEVLRPHAKAGQILGEDTQLVADLGLDSVRIMDLMLEIEDHFDISIPLNVLPDIRTVKDLCVQLHKMTNPSS